MIVCRSLAAVDNPSDGAFEECVNCIVKKMEWNQSIFILILHILCCFLEPGEHGTLTAGQMLTGIAVLANLGKHLLDHDELIRHKGESCRKLRTIRKALDVKNGIVESIEVFEYGVFLVIDHAKKLICRICFRQNTLFDNFINGGRGKAEARIEASLNFGKVIAGDMDNGVNRLLTCHHDPNLAVAANANLFYKRLQIDHQVTIVTNVLTDFIHHKQQSEILALAVYIFLNVSYELGDAQFIRFLTIEPVPRRLFAHAERRLQNRNNVILKERKGIAGLRPRRTIDLLKGFAELLRLALLFNEAFQLGNFQIIAVKPAVIVEHLCKDAQHCGLILRERTFDVNVEKDRLRRHGHTFNRLSIHHRVIEFVCKVVNRSFTADFLIGKQVREDFQEMRFTTPKEAGNPHADFISRLVDSLCVVVKECAEVTAKLLGNYVFAEFLFQTPVIILHNLDNAVDVSFNVLLEHILYFHVATSIIAD